MILKLECLFYLNIYILFYLILYSKSHFDSNKSKKRSNRKKNMPYNDFEFGLKKIIFFLQITHNGEHIKNSKKKFQKSVFLMGLSS